MRIDLKGMPPEEMEDEINRALKELRDEWINHVYVDTDHEIAYILYSKKRLERD
jgi:hypothetical protein